MILSLVGWGLGDALDDGSSRAGKGTVAGSSSVVIKPETGGSDPV
jgi:hypothetical protein